MSRRQDECMQFSHEIFRASDTLLRGKNPTPQQFAKISLGALYAKAGPTDDIKKAQHDMLAYIKDVANGRELKRALAQLERAVQGRGASHMALAHGHRAIGIAHLQLQNTLVYTSMATALQESARASLETFMETFCIHWNLFDYCKTVQKPKDPYVPVQAASIIPLLQEIAENPEDYVSGAHLAAQSLFIPAIFAFRTGATVYDAARRGNLPLFRMQDDALLDAMRWTSQVDALTGDRWALEPWLKNQAISALNMLKEQDLL